DFTLMAQEATHEGVPPLLRSLVRVPIRRATLEGQSRDSTLAQRLAALPEVERARTLLDLVRGEIASAFGSGGLGAVPPDRPLRELGLDSLMAVDLRTRLSSLTESQLPATLLFDFPTARAVTTHLLTLLFQQEEPRSTAIASPS